MSEFGLIVEQDEDEVEAAQVFVDGMIGGRNYRFLLDTGAARTSVLADSYTSTFDAIGTSSSSGVFAASSDDLIIVPSVTVGPVSKQNFVVARMAGKFPQRSNLIGMDFLKDSCCHFLFDEHRVLVDADHEGGEGSSFQELFLDRKFHPYVDVQFGMLNAKAVWDTGASITVVDMNLIHRCPTFFQEAGHSEGTDSTGTTVDTPMFVLSAAVMGSHTFPPHKVAGVDLSQVNSTIEVPMDLILGYSTLSKANWLFDFPHRKWAVSKRLSDS